MQKFTLILSALLFTFTPALQAEERQAVEVIENKKVAKIDVVVENLAKGDSVDPRVVLSSLRTKVGEPFSQAIFDEDLKQLSEEYERVEPRVTVRDGQAYIKLKLWMKPYIAQINWEGNKNIKTKKLQSELGIKIDSQYNRDTFVIAFNKLKEYYVKKGFFEAKLSYSVRPIEDTNQVEITINIHEGRSAHIDSIQFEGLDKKEQSDILSMINTKKYNFFTSWLTGSGTFNEEAIAQDKLVIVNYLQNEGYADAYVSIELKTSPKDQIIVHISADKGPLFHFGNITFTGNEIRNEEEVEDAIGIKTGDVYGPDRLKQAAEELKSMYGRKGYIDTNVRYELRLSPSEPVYDVHFVIEESRQYKIGVIRILGNVSTEANVILNNSSLTPGEVFDSDKLKETQMRLQSLGFFKTVNVYAVRNNDDNALGPEYRDINIEVEETSSGSASIFFGLNSTTTISGGFDVTENNFNIKGLATLFKKGLRGLRGGGQYAQAKVSIGDNYQTYSISWLNPHFWDTDWRVGFDVAYSRSHITSKSFQSDAISFNWFASHPITQSWSWGWKYRLQNSVISVSDEKAKLSDQEARQVSNSGIVSGVGLYLTFDTTNNIWRPNQGFRSTLEADIAGVRRHNDENKMFAFSKYKLSNTFYQPLWKKATLKLRADANMMTTLGAGRPILLPANERYYLGGENSVRGYKPAIIGPKYEVDKNDDKKKDDTTGDPIGGASSILLSAEVQQNIFRPLDLFAFFDAGSVSLSEFSVNKLNMSVGVGVRINVAQNLPFTVGYGYPLNDLRTVNKDGKKERPEYEGVFFSMGGQF